DRVDCNAQRAARRRQLAIAPQHSLDSRERLIVLRHDAMVCGRLRPLGASELFEDDTKRRPPRLAPGLCREKRTARKKRGDDGRGKRSGGGQSPGADRRNRGRDENDEPDPRGSVRSEEAERGTGEERYSGKSGDSAHARRVVQSSRLDQPRKHENAKSILICMFRAFVLSWLFEALKELRR